MSVWLLRCVIITANHRALSAIFIALSNLTGLERPLLPVEMSAA